MMNLVIVDDHQLVIDGFAKLLAEREVNIIGKFTDPRRALQEIPSLEPDIVLSDLDMPYINGVELLQAVRELRPQQKFMILSMHLNQQVLKKIINLKVESYISKNAHPEELFQALEAVYNGRSYFSADITASLASKNNSIERQPSLLIRNLSKRETEVLSLIAEGESTKSIADILSISPGTVENHRSSIMTKLEVKNVAGMVRIAVQEGLV